MPSGPLRASLIAALGLALVPALSAQPAPPPTSYTVAGTVVSASDNHPIQRATVDLLSAPEEKPVASTAADELGHFAFANLPKGEFTLRGQAPGFLQTHFEQHGQFSTAVVTGAAVPTEGLTLKLNPLGRLAGTVTDEYSEPVRNAQVHIYRRDPLAGDRRLDQASQLYTDDLGHYELGHLVPGTYFVAVTATPWYAVHPIPASVTAQAGMGIVPYTDPSLDVAYPVTYYPTGSDPDHASPIQIDGNNARADLQLTPTPAVTLSFPASGGNGTRPVPQLQATVFGQAQYAPVQLEQNPAGTLIAGIAPGNYILRTNSPVTNPDGSSHFQTGPATPVHIGPDGSSTLTPNSSSLAHLRLTLRSADGEALPPNLQLQLNESGHRPDPELRRPVSSHQVELDAAPGDYYLALPNSPGLFIHDITVSGKPLPSGDLHLAPGDSLSATVTLARGSHSLRGFVHSARTGPLSGAMLLLIPADQHLPPRLFFRDQSNLDGSFLIPQLPPGPYLLLALAEPAWNAAWLSPGFLSRFLPHATPVLIRENSPTHVDLLEPLNIQPL